MIRVPRVVVFLFFFLFQNLPSEIKTVDFFPLVVVIRGKNCNIFFTTRQDTLQKKL